MEGYKLCDYLVALGQSLAVDQSNSMPVANSKLQTAKAKQDRGVRHIGSKLDFRQETRYPVMSKSLQMEISKGLRPAQHTGCFMEGSPPATTWLRMQRGLVPVGLKDTTIEFTYKWMDTLKLLYLLGSGRG